MNGNRISARARAHARHRIARNGVGSCWRKLPPQTIIWRLVHTAVGRARPRSGEAGDRHSPWRRGGTGRSRTAGRHRRLPLAAAPAQPQHVVTGCSAYGVPHRPERLLSRTNRRDSFPVQAFRGGWVRGTPAAARKARLPLLSGCGGRVMLRPSLAGGAHDHSAPLVVHDGARGAQGALAGPVVMTAQQQVSWLRAGRGGRHHDPYHGPGRTAAGRFADADGHADFCQLLSEPGPVGPGHGPAASEHLHAITFTRRRAGR